jgi:hypothetical protein
MVAVKRPGAYSTRRKSRNRKPWHIPRKRGKLAIAPASGRIVNTRMTWPLYITAYRIARARGMTLQGLIRHLLTVYCASVLRPRIADPAGPENGAVSTPV